jgi:hypothetical protein
MRVVFGCHERASGGTDGLKRFPTPALVEVLFRSCGGLKPHARPPMASDQHKEKEGRPEYPPGGHLPEQIG